MGKEKRHDRKSRSRDRPRQIDDRDAQFEEPYPTKAKLLKTFKDRPRQEDERDTPQDELQERTNGRRSRSKPGAQSGAAEKNERSRSNERSPPLDDRVSPPDEVPSMQVE